MDPNTEALKWEPEKAKQIVNYVKELRECSVCLTDMCAPIYQCTNGHPLCSMCKFGVKDNSCPICREVMGSIRCLVLEELIKPLEVPYDCPALDFKCGYTGNIPDIITHLKDVHELIMHDGSEIRVESVLEKLHTTSGVFTVFKCYGCYFCLCFWSFDVENHKGCCLASIQFIGEVDEANRFSYSLDLRSRDGRTKHYPGVPMSIRVRNHDFKTAGMLIIPTWWKDNEQVTLVAQISEKNQV